MPRPLLLLCTCLLWLLGSTAASAQEATPTPPLFTPTPLPPPPGLPMPLLDASFSSAVGWSCGDFPCEDDIEGFLQRIRLSPGFSAEFAGRFPGQLTQITTDSSGRIYGAVLENGSLYGAIYVLGPEGSAERYSPTLISPIGLAFQPGTDVLYISARLTPLNGGLLLRLQSDGFMEVVLSDLPCCYLEVGNQPNGMSFGPDGYLYLGVGATTDHAESREPDLRAYDPVQPLEAAIVRIQPHTGERAPYASGLRNPYDVTFDSTGQAYATDSGLVTGQGDRLMALVPGAFYGWPFYRGRGCEACPPSAGVSAEPDWLPLADYTLPRGLTTYTGSHFPPNVRDTLFVALWNGTETAQRILWVDPQQVGREGYVPVTFMTGLIRPVDVVVAPDGTLLVADYVYGHVWRVHYTGQAAPPVLPASPTPDTTPALSFLTPTAAPVSATPAPPVFFVTNTPGG